MWRSCCESLFRRRRNPSEPDYVDWKVIRPIRELARRGLIARLVSVVAIVGCGGERAPRAASAMHDIKPDRCGEYRRAAQDARQTPGDIEARVVNGCGCSFVIRTTAEKAAEVRDKYPEWIRASCSVNCDTPCSAMVQ
jgi:hypothetical protein